LNTSTAGGSGPRRFALPIVAAVLFTLVNAVKPVMIDDTAYVYFARQIASRPLDPYGFALFWWDAPQPANEILAPPVFSYYLALVVSTTGEDPFVWKLALFPWSLLLAFSLQELLRRFAPGMERSLLVMLLFSPALLPSLNLMIDVPALSLSIAALNLFFRATERSSYGLAALSGLMAGVAMQTKYTGFLAPGAMLLWSLTTGRWRLWPVAAVIAGSLFAGWEYFVALRYGASHFLLALSGQGGSSLEKYAANLPFLPSYLGGLAPFGVALGLGTLGVGQRWVWSAVAVMLAAFVAVVLVDVRFVGLAGLSHALFGTYPNPPVEFQLAEVIFNTISGAGAVVLVLIVRELRREDKATGDPCTRFLVLWLVLEVIGFTVMTPFPAARRVLGVGLVAALLVGRLAARRGSLLWRRGLLPGLIAGNVLLALGYQALDWYGARLQQQAVERATRYIAEHGDGRVWYTGHWGFQFYAERAGMEPVVPPYFIPRESRIRFPEVTQFVPGDWLVVPDAQFIIQQLIRLPEQNLELCDELILTSPIPLRTIPNFYAGRTPVEHFEGPALVVRLYRVRAGFTAERLPSRS